MGDHDRVARMFGDDRRGGDAQGERVAADDRRGGIDPARQAIAIDQDVTGRAAQRRRQRVHRQRHRLHRRPIDVEAIDLLGFDDADADDRTGHQPIVEPVALGGGELLRIVHAARASAFRQDHRGGDDGTGQWPAAGFIDAGEGRGKESLVLAARHQPSSSA